MEIHGHTSAPENYTFPSKLKTWSFALMGVGVLALIYGIVAHLGGQRIWANVLVNGFFFFGIALTVTFFMAVQYAAEAAWATVLKRIFEAVSSYLPYGAVFLVLVWAVGSMHGHHLYHWMDSEVYNPESDHYDALIAGKRAYLNLPFFWVRAIVFIGVYIWFASVIRKRSLQEDAEGGTKLHFGNQALSAAFLVFFGYTSTVAAWDWIMSIDTHWFSTLFGWYVFSGMWISGMVAVTLLIIYLKANGYVPQINESHVQDMGKWMFAVSCLWTYLWFSQFMLIWYSNIPEEVTYYIARIGDYRWLYFGMVFVNFVFPFFILMDKEMKRSSGALAFVGIVIFIGHWVDVFMMVAPGTLKADGFIGPMEIGMFLGFLGLFVFVVLNTLSKAPLLVKNHPYLDESLHFHQN